MRRWIQVRLAGATCFAILLLLAPTSARAACPPLDVACLADELTEGAGDPGTDPPADPNDPIGTLDRVGGPAVSPVTDRLDQIQHGEGDGAPVGRGGNTSGNERGPTGRPGGGRAGTGLGTILDARRGAEGPRTAPSPFDPGRPVSDARVGIGPGLGPLLTEAARSVLTVLLLCAIAGIFVLIQDRLDRRDPRLATAPLRPEVIPFR